MYIFFGSRAEGIHKTDSDFDTGIIFTDEKEPEDILYFLKQPYEEMTMSGPCPHTVYLSYCFDKRRQVMQASLTIKEKKIIDEFKKDLMAQFPGDIIKVIVFGSKARGNADKESDIDILVVSRNDDWRHGDRIRDIGYELDDKLDYRLSIQVLPESHVKYLKANSFQFIKNVEREGFVV